MSHLDIQNGESNAMGSALNTWQIYASDCALALYHLKGGQSKW